MIRRFYWFIYFAFLFACDTASNVNPPNNNYFIKYFGQDGNQTARDLIVYKDALNKDAFYILGNSTEAEGARQKVYLAKANALGELLWQKTYGTSVDTDARDFLITADGLYLVVIANRGSDALLSRYDLKGEKNGNDSVLINNAFVNSVTELTDHGYIVEGYQKSSTGQSNELHFRWSGSPWGPYTGGVWTPSFINPDPGNQSANYFGVNTFEVSPTTFYTFGYTNAIYQSGNDSLKFWSFHLGQYGGTGPTTDNGTFDPNGYSTNKTLTYALQAAIGGHLLVGVSSHGSVTNLKVAITNSDTTLAFHPGWVLHDVLLEDITDQTIDLGNSVDNFQFATACSTTFNNFILANNYSTPTGKSDIMLMKVNNALVPQWGDKATNQSNYLLFGGDGDDTAAAVAELPDGHIMVLGTMQLGNPPAQSKITLMKLNSSGKLAD